MAAFSNGAWIGSRTIRPTAAQIAQVKDRDPAFYGISMDKILTHMGYFILPLRIAAAVADANTVSGLAVPALIPFKVVAIQVGVESAANTTALLDVQKSAAATPTSYATMSTGAVDVKTGAGTMQSLPVLDGAEDVEVGGRLKLVATGSGSGAVVGSFGILHAFRL